jgi:steroid 5-alpha reductase family enzyme
VLATDEEDPRYAEMLGDKPFSFAVRRVFVTQGVAMYLVSLPVQVAAALGTGVVLWLAVVGVVVWLVGLVFETVGDAQLSTYRAQPRDSRPPVMDRGLWRFTRHPNYFGDSAVWWGIWVVAVSGALWALLTVVSPVVMTYFLVFATGAKLLEREMMKRPGYPEYAARTSMFLPLPPKKQPVVS